MRSNKQLRRTESLRVTNATIYGGYGYVQINGWSGSVIWGRDESGWEHVSVAPFNDEVPTWDDMCKLKDIFFGDEEMALQFHPKKSQYVNVVENCLHLWRPKDEELLRYLEGKA